MKNNKLHVGIIIGGKSVEHDISILSGLQVYHAIDKEKYEVTLFYISKDSEWFVGTPLTELETYQKQDFSKCFVVSLFNENHTVYYKGVNGKPKATRIDVFVPVVHGDGVEDGTLSGYLDILDVPYTSAGVVSSSIAQDKIYTKEVISHYHVPQVPYFKVTKNEYYPDLIQKIEEKLGYPVIIKPARLGSSIGIVSCQTKEELKKGIEETFQYGNRILVEKMLTNFKEYNMAVMKEGNKINASCIEEVMKSDNILSFVDKYERMDKLSEVSNRIIPANIAPVLESEIRNICIKTYLALDMKGVVRIDCLYDLETEKIYFNEINTIPGSLAFYLFDKGNFNFTKLIDILIKHAMLIKHQENKLLKVFTSNVLNKKGNKLGK